MVVLLLASRTLSIPCPTRWNQSENVSNDTTGEIKDNRLRWVKRNQNEVKQGLEFHKIQLQLNISGENCGKNETTEDMMLQVREI